MQDRSALWKSIVSDGNFYTEAKAEINGTEYTEISAPMINRASCSKALSVGNCVSATLQLSIRTEDIIPRSAEVIVRQRVSNGEESSEWLPAGTFFIGKRGTDPVSGILTFTCYDAMLKANDAYPLSESDVWPKTMKACVREIADLLGVPVDARTWDFVIERIDYFINEPSGSSMIEILQYIGAVYGGNWIITPQNKLRFVPVESPMEDTENLVNVYGILGGVDVGNTITVSGVRMTTSEGTAYTSGDNIGYVIEIADNLYATQSMCDELYQKLNGVSYQPYTFSSSIYDPAAEIGDTVFRMGTIRSILCAELVSVGASFRGDISAPGSSEVADEYPYNGLKKSTKDAYAKAADAQETASTAKEIAENTLIYDHSYELNADKTVASFTAFLYRGGQDVKTEFKASQFLWWYKTESVEEYLGSGYTIDIDISDMGYGAHIIGRFVQTEEQALLSVDYGSMKAVGGETLTVMTDANPNGESIRVRDLSKTTILALTDSVMVVTPEEEKLATVEALGRVLRQMFNDYEDLINKPQIEGVTLEGNKTYEELNLKKITNTELEEMLTI